MKNEEIDRLLSEEDAHICKLHDIVKESIKSEELIVNNLLNPPAEVLTRARVSQTKLPVSVGVGNSSFFLWPFLLSG